MISADVLADEVTPPLRVHTGFWLAHEDANCEEGTANGIRMLLVPDTISSSDSGRRPRLVRDRS